MTSKKQEFFDSFEVRNLIVENKGMGIKWQQEYKATERLWEWIESYAQDVAQACYLECLAVECGQGQCSEAIATKFPDLVSRHKEGENEGN